jgi:co-chaperonin GroES (HSP10)
MIVPLKDKLVVKPHQASSLIYMSNVCNNMYEVVSISKDEALFKAGELLIIEASKLIIVDNSQKLYIVHTSDVLAKVEE